MAWPRMTTRRTMIGVALVAVNWWAFESLVTGETRPNSWLGSLALGLMPALDWLVIGACLAIEQLRRRGEIRSFLVGFLSFGGAAFVVAAVFLLGYPQTVSWYVRDVADALRSFWVRYVMVTGRFTYRHANFLQGIFVVLAFAIPQLLCGVFGGWLTHRLSVVIRDDTSPAEPGRRSIPWRIARRVAVVASLLSLALALGSAIQQRSQEFRRKAGYYAKMEERAGQWRDHLANAAEWEERAIREPNDPNLQAVARREITQAREAVARSQAQLPYYATLKRKYERLARYPWLFDSPNPPRP